MILSINERQEPLWNGLHQSLAQLLVPVILSQSLFYHYPLDPSHSPAQNLLFLPDPFFLSVIPHSLDTFKFQSANWNVMIPSISGRGQTVSSLLFLHYKYLALFLFQAQMAF